MIASPARSSIRQPTILASLGVISPLRVTKNLALSSCSGVGFCVGFSLCSVVQVCHKLYSDTLSPFFHEFHLKPVQNISFLNFYEMVLKIFK